MYALPVCCLAGFASFSAYAQENPVAVAGKPSWIITPTLALNFTQTDNVNPGNGPKKSDFITQISPGIRIEANSARASGNLTYNWQHYEYANESGYGNQQQSLAADGKLELVEQWLFLDARANIAQRPVSAFGTQGVGNELANGNRTETTTYLWSPYLKGNLVGAADYEFRYSNAQTSADAGVMANNSGTSSEAWTGRLSGATPLALLGWSFNAESQRVEQNAIRDTRSDRLIGTLEYRVDPQIRLSLSAGSENYNYGTVGMERHNTGGYGIEWAPTERTLLSLKNDKHDYGDSHNLSFSHRTALSAWKISDSRSMTLPAQQMTQAPVSSAYELLNLQLTSSIPDSAERARMASLMLQQSGVSPDAQAYGNIMSQQAFLQRRQEASVALMGANNTVTLSLQKSTSDSLQNAINVGDDFAQSSNIQQSGISGNWAHKLSPDSALTLNAMLSRSRGDTDTLSSDLRSVSLLLTTKLGISTAGTVGLRQTSFDSNNGNSYDELAVTGSLFLRF